VAKEGTAGDVWKELGVNGENTRVEVQSTPEGNCFFQSINTEKKERNKIH